MDICDLYQTLLTWNLSSESFPEVIQDGPTILVGFANNTVAYYLSTVEGATVWIAALDSAMKQRSDNYWGVR